jgi:hypothetical protein
LCHPRAGGAGLVGEEDCGADERGRGQALEDIFRRLGNSQRAHGRPRQRFAGLAKPVDEVTLAVVQQDLPDAAQGFVDDPRPFRRVPAFDEPVAQEPVPGHGVDEHVACAERHKRQQRDPRIQHDQRSHDQHAREQASHQRQGRVQNAGRHPAGIVDSLGSQRRAVVPRVEMTVASQVFVEHGDLELTADGEREARHQQRTRQVDGVGDADETDEGQPQDRNEGALAVEVKKRAQRRQRARATARHRVTERGQERKHGRDTAQGRNRHPQRDATEQCQSASLARAQQAPDLKQRFHRWTSPAGHAGQSGVRKPH